MKNTSSMHDRPSILFTACDPRLMSILGRRLSADGWKVEEAENLLDAERKGARSRPKVLLIDTSCSIEIWKEVKRLRVMPTLKNTKIVLLSATGDIREISESRKAGTDAYFIKGHFSSIEIINHLRTLIAK